MDSPLAVYEKLALLAFSLEEEERGISVTEVARRTKQTFYAEKVTKSFYAKFKTEHEAFLKQIKGIDDEENRKWYASLMLNRLMFVHFIQRKGFLDGDHHYLKTKLTAVKAQLGEDKFHSFYRSFLLRLFHEGLGAQSHSAQLVKLIGCVPYLNGGLFEVHKLEEGKAGEVIEIPDKAFNRIFEFFDEYDWHLDNRPLGNEREINPDVLGYIFEQYINNKQMGRITPRKTSPNISPRTRSFRSCLIAPDGWNKTADATFGLPTETWREHVARRIRCLELRGKLTNGEIHTINDLITWNLDIRQFAQDVILQTDSPDLVRAVYRASRARA